MNVLVVEPGYLPYEKEIKDGADHLEQMQAIVGGLIEPIYITTLKNRGNRKDDRRSCNLLYLIPYPKIIESTGYKPQSK